MLRLLLPWRLSTLALTLTQGPKQQMGRQIKIRVCNYKSQKEDAPAEISQDTADISLDDDLMSHEEYRKLEKENAKHTTLQIEKEDLAEHAEESDENDLVVREEEKMDKEKLKFVRETLLYRGDDPQPEKLVTRPEKGVVWGLGGELLRRKKNLFKFGEMPDVEDVIAFLELEQGKDVTLIDLHELGRKDLSQYAIIVSTFSCRHNHSIASSLLKAVKEINIQNLPNKPRIFGRKDDEWILVQIGEIAVHLFTEEAREEIDLEWKWRNPPTEEAVEKWEKMVKHNKRKKIFEPFED